MARNRFSGTCYRCGARVEPNEGHYERHNGGWRTQHAECAIAYRWSNVRQGSVPRPGSKAEAEAIFLQRHPEAADA